MLTRTSTLPIATTSSSKHDHDDWYDYCDELDDDDDDDDRAC